MFLATAQTPARPLYSILLAPRKAGAKRPGGESTLFNEKKENFMKARFPTTAYHSLLAMVLAAVAANLAGCAPEVVPTTGPHPPLPVEQVKFYSQPPMKYEILGTIEVPVTPEMKWDSKGDSTTGGKALKTKAGALGANGVLLQADMGKYDEMVGVGFDGKYYLVPLRREPRTAIATAIYVIQEK
jgi:hypothetical protein